MIFTNKIVIILILDIFENLIEVDIKNLPNNIL